MLERKCFFKESPKKPNIFPYINRLHDILKDQDPFPLIRMPLTVQVAARGLSRHRMTLPHEQRIQLL